MKYLEQVNHTDRMQTHGCQELGEKAAEDKRLVETRFCFEMMKMLWN